MVKTVFCMSFFSPAGVLTQGGGVFGTFVSSFYLQFSQDGRRWYTYKELVTDARPRAKVRLLSGNIQGHCPASSLDNVTLALQVFSGNQDDRGVAESRLDRMVSAQFVRLLPHDFHNGIYLRLEIMGCEGGELFFFLLLSSSCSLIITANSCFSCPPQQGAAETGSSAVIMVVV